MNGTPDESARRHPSGRDPSAAGRRRRRRWTLLGAVVGGTGLLTMLLAFGLSRDPTQLRSPLLSRPAPDFTLSRLDGTGEVSLSALRGQIVVVNFWASWCAECRVEHPALTAAWRRYQDRGVVFLGIPFQDRPSASKAYAATYGGGWPILSDPDSRTAIAYGVYGVPETFVIAPDGVVVFKTVGAIGYSTLTDQITRLLPDSPA